MLIDSLIVTICVLMLKMAVVKNDKFFFTLPDIRKTA